MAHNGFPDATVLELIEHIYAAGSDPSGWAAFVDRVSKEAPGIRFALGSMLTIERKGYVHQNFAHAGYDPDSVRSFLDHYQYINPYESLHRAIPVGQVVTVTSLVTRDWLERQAFYHEWLKPADNLTHGVSVVIARDQWRMLRLSIDIPERLGELEEPCAQLLVRLGPHLARAFQLNERLEASAATQNALDGILARVEGAAVILGPHAQVLAINPHAEALVRAVSLVRITPANRLAFRQADDEAAFQRALAAALGVAASNGPCVFAVKDRKLGTATVYVLPLRAASGMAAVLARPQAMLIIRKATAGVTAPAELLRALYRLTPAEAAVVLQIAGGQSVADAADALHVSRTTARNQLAAAMTKLDVHRQAELVGLVAGLAPRLVLDGTGE